MGEIKVEIIQKNNLASTEIEKTIFKLDQQIAEMSTNADELDYFIAMSSGILCAMLDIFWVGEFNLERGRDFSEEKVEKLVKKIAAKLGYKDDNIKGAIAFLERRFPLASDGNTSDFGGGLQHHLRDFAHHPTIVGLFFSILTQFTEMSYGTCTSGKLIAVPIEERSKEFIGKGMADKLFRGTVIWFFHLVSDVAGSSSTAGLSGGTGIPGPILSLAKEVSVLPIFRNIHVGDEKVSKFLSRIFNGTMFAKHDINGKIIKGTEIRFDFRGEVGFITEARRQALPVLANECIVRGFYFIKHLVKELRNCKKDYMMQDGIINWKQVELYDNPILTRMLTVATGVFTTLDITEAVVTKNYLISVNYVGIGRFTMALGSEMVGLLKLRNVKAIREMYEHINNNTFGKSQNDIYSRMGENMDADKFGLTLEQTEILYNLEFYKTINDVNCTSVPIMKSKIIELKKEWVKEWKNYMSLGFAGFVQDETAVLHWYSKDELIEKIEKQNPTKVWFRLVLLEAMLFEPYYTLSLEKDKKGNEVPSKKYDELQNPVNGFKKSEGDQFLETFFDKSYYQKGYIKRLRKTYNKVMKELSEVRKAMMKGILITAVIVIPVVTTAGALAPTIAVALVGSNFAGLSGAALTSACLAYLGGGAVAAGGLGIAGGTMAIVGGGAILGVGIGAGVGGTFSAVGLAGKKTTIIQSAKLLVSVREIFLNDEHDVEYSNTIYEQYVRNIADIEKGLVELKLKAEVASKDEMKQLKEQIKNTEESVRAMKIAMKNMNTFNSSFATGDKEVDI